jgi:hypothetical protein
MKNSHRAALVGLTGLFVLAQAALAGLAASGAHRHAWDVAESGQACWMCLVVSLTSIGAVLAAAVALSNETIAAG